MSFKKKKKTLKKRKKKKISIETTFKYQEEMSCQMDCLGCTCQTSDMVISHTPSTFAS